MKESKGTVIGCHTVYAIPNVEFVHVQCYYGQWQMHRNREGIPLQDYKKTEAREKAHITTISSVCLEYLWNGFAREND